MKKNWIGLLLVVALIIVAAVIFSSRPGATRLPDLDLGGSSDQSTTNQSDTNSGTESNSSNSGTGSTDQNPPSTAAIPRSAKATLSHVAYVHDGDTLYLQPDGTSSREDQIKVRLIGIDTPELKPEVECFGLEARDYLRDTLPVGTEVWIMADREPYDKYGRALLYLWTTDDRSVNLDLVLNGYATALNIAPSNSYWKQFDAAESAARTANAGLWGSC